MVRLEGKTAVITGGNSGIGLASARRFIAEGAQVVGTGRRQKELDEAVKIIGGDVLVIQGDISNPSDLDRLLDTVKSAKGGIDVLLANAGVGGAALCTRLSAGEKFATIDLKANLLPRRSPDDPEIRRPCAGSPAMRGSRRAPRRQPRMSMCLS